MNTAGYNIVEYGRLLCRLIVAGTRYEANKGMNKQACFKCIKYAILKVLKKYPDLNLQDIEIVQGGARGVDNYGKQFAREYSLMHKEFKADWDSFGKRAGYLRNKEMAEYVAKADISVLVAFPAMEEDIESRGTRNMIELAKEHKFTKIVTMEISIR